MAPAEADSASDAKPLACPRQLVEILASVNKGIEDVIDYNLKVLFVGINPGLYILPPRLFL